MTQKPRTLILYGKTKTGKTSNLKKLARWFYDKYKLKIRLITSDGGGYRPFFDSDGLISKGIVEVFDNTNRALALQDIHRLGDGCWPNGKGELERDPNILNENYRSAKFRKEEVGAYFVEGLGSLGAVLEAHLTDQLADAAMRNEREKVAGYTASFLYLDGEYATGGMQPGHYKSIQTELHKIVVKRFGQLPVKLVVFTSKETLGIEVTSKQKKSGEQFASSSGEPIFGPEATGIALTEKVPSWFENCIHLEAVLAKEGGKLVDKRIAWYQRHYRQAMIDGTPTDIPCLAGSSCPAERYEEMLKRFPGGYVQFGFKRGLDKVY